MKKSYKISVITLFPELVKQYADASILGRAQAKNAVQINCVQIRDFALDKHKVTDDLPYGGGAGMVLKAEPILRACQSLKIRQSSKTKILIMSAKGQPFNQGLATDLAQNYNNLVIINGRYEGIDERVKLALNATEVSIGNYVLTDGDVASMVVMSAVVRLLPGVINADSLREESHAVTQTSSANDNLEYPQYTRPESFKYKGQNYAVPEVLLSGNHQKIAVWRKSQNNS